MNYLKTFSVRFLIFFFAFLIVAIVAVMLVHTAAAEKKIDVTVTTIDEKDIELNGRVGIIDPYAWHESSYTYKQKAGESNRFYGIWGGIHSGWSDSLIIIEGTTYTMDASTKVITTEEGTEETRFNIKFSTMTVTVVTKDSDEKPLAGRVWVAIPYAWKDSELTYEQAIGGLNRFYGRYGGRSSGWTEYFEVESGKTYEIDTLDGKIIEKASEKGDTRVEFKFHLIKVTISTVDPDGEELFGRVLATGHYKWETSPFEYEQADGGSYRYYAQWGGLYTGWLDAIVVTMGNTYTIDARTGELISTTSSSDSGKDGETWIHIVFEPMYVTITAIDQNGIPVNGRVWSNIPYEWQDESLTVEQANGGKNRFYGRWGGLSTGWTDYAIMEKDTIYTVDALTLEITTESNSEGEGTKVFIVFESIEVTLTSVDTSGKLLEGRVRVTGHYSWQDPPFEYDQANGGSSKFSAIWGGLYTGWSEYVVIFEGNTYTIDAQTGEVKSKSSKGETIVRIMFDPIKITVTNVDMKGKKLDGQVGIITPYSWEDSSVTITMADGGKNRFYGRWEGLSTGWSEYIMIEEHTTYEIDAMTGVITPVKTTGKTEVNIVFDPIDVTVMTVDTEGSLLDGRVRVISLKTWEDSPMEYEQANGGSQRYYAIWGGLYTGWSAYIVIQEENTYTINARTLEVSSTSSAGETTVKIVFEPIEVTVTAIGTGDEGQVWVSIPYTREDSTLTYTQAAGGINRFYGRWGGLSTGWTERIVINEGMTYTYDTILKTITSTSSSDGTNVNIVFYPIEVSVHTIDKDNPDEDTNGLDGRILVTGISGWQDAPIDDYKQAEGGSNRFYAIWGGLYTGWSEYVEISTGWTYTIDAQTGVVTSEYTPSFTRVNIAFEVIKVTVKAVDEEGTDLEGRVWTGIPYKWQDSPIAYEQANSGKNRFYGQWGGLRTGWTDYIDIYKGTSYSINARTLEVTEISDTDDIIIYIVFEPIYVDVMLMDTEGEFLLDGTVLATNHYSWVPSGAEYQFAVGGNVRFYGRWGALSTGWMETITISEDTTYTFDALTGELTNSSSSGTHVRIVFEPIEVTVYAMDGEGNELEDARVWVIAPYTWKDDSLTYTQANGGRNRFYGRWNKISTGWCDYTVIEKDRTYTYDYLTGKVTWEETKGVNEVIILFREDIKAPEAVISWDPETQEIVVSGIDDVDEDVKITEEVIEKKGSKTTIRYTLADDQDPRNTLQITIKITEKKDSIEAEILSLKYNDDDEFEPPKNHYIVFFEIYDDDGLESVEQDIEVKKNFKITTSWESDDDDDDKTEIDIEAGDGYEEYEYDGLVIVDLMTADGVITYSIP